MKWLRAVGMSFALYSRVPMPPLDWESESRRLTLYVFPLVGLAVSAAWAVWLALCWALDLGAVLRAVGLTLLPILVTGGIHMDGFCDVCDALASHQSRERKLEILKDSRVGAFAVLGCVCYLLALFGLWCEVETLDGNTLLAVLLLPLYSRCLSGYGALRLPNARGEGMLSAVTGTGFPWSLVLGALLCVLALGALNPWYLLSAAAGLAVYFYYKHTALKEFGGVTGDLAGWFLQLCELGCLASLGLAQRLEAVL